MDNRTKYRQVQRMVKPVARCRGHKDAGTQERSGRCIADDILAQRFTPYVVQNIKNIPGSFRKVERAFFASLSNLCGLYDIPEWNYSGYCYPLNISMAHRETAERLKDIDPELHLVIVYEKDVTITLATYKASANTHTLYYIPVRPVFDLFMQKQRRKLSALILSVFSYLYKIHKMPLYSDQSSYLYSVYEILGEYCREDDVYERSTIGAYLQAIRRSSHCGRKLYKKIRGVKNLSLFGKRIKEFKAVSKVEKQFKNTAKALYQLYERFPEKSVFDNLSTEFLDPHAEYTIYFDQYLSFIWDTEDCLMESITEYVNCDFQEATDEECPCSVQLFDKPQQTVTIDLSFEERVLELINEMNYCITNL